MNAAVEAVNQAARLWWTHVLHITWQGALLAAVVLVILRFGRRWPVGLRAALVLIALVKFAIPATWTAPTGVFSRLGPAVTAPAPDTAAAGWTGAEAAGPSGRRGGLCWQAPLMGLHLAGTLAVAGWIAVQGARVARMTRRADVRIPVRVRRRFARLAREMGLRRRVRLLATRRPITPMAIGLFRRAVVIPSSLLGDEHVETILAHELAHHRRGDVWLNWAHAVLAAAWWFHPALWLLGRSLRQVCEDGCDDLLLRRHIARDDRYCQALLQAARTLRRQLSFGGAAAFAERPHTLGDRIRRIMDPRVRRRPCRPVATAAVMIALAAAVLPGLPSAPVDGENALAPAPVAVAPQPAGPAGAVEPLALEATDGIEPADGPDAPLAWPMTGGGLAAGASLNLPWWQGRTDACAGDEPAPFRPAPLRSLASADPFPLPAAGRQLHLPRLTETGLEVKLCLSSPGAAADETARSVGPPRSSRSAGGRTGLEWTLGDGLGRGIFRAGSADAPIGDGGGAVDEVPLGDTDLPEPGLGDPLPPTWYVQLFNNQPASSTPSITPQSIEPGFNGFQSYSYDDYVAIWTVYPTDLAVGGQVVPEPGTVGLLLIGAGAAAAWRRRGRA